MSSSSPAAPTMRARLATQWEYWKPIGLAAIGGLIVGPILSGMLGFQVRTSTAEAATRASVVEQQAMFCQERVRASLPADAGKIDWSRGYELAKQWSAMPGGTADAEVQQACARRLSD